jgi:glutathione synthase/RimK-type ligase-like ATP-grasp enzyme
MQKLRLAILQNEVPDDHLLWIHACAERADLLEWEVVDITRADWLQRMRAGKFDAMLATPPGWSTPFRIQYDERITILHAVLGIPIYPSFEEIQVYENKKYLAYWLEANNIPHPKTWTLYYADEALALVQKSALPLVGKTSIGGGGSGVTILKTREAAVEYVKNTFSGKGTSLDVGPKWRKKGFFKRVLKKLLHPAEFRLKLQQYQFQRSEVQKDYVILQEFIPHEFEWRVVRIGDSFFAHKKLVKGDKASGSLLKGYENPPLNLLDFVEEITDHRGFLSQAVDLFEGPDGRYLVNEMQCIFGQSDPYQMLVDGQPGRYRRIGGAWVFEPGDFNRIECFALRVEHVLDLLSGTGFARVGQGVTEAHGV